MAIELFAHNKETYENIVRLFETSNRVGAVQPTGTGKSFLFLKWIEDHPYDFFVVLSPSTEIFTQLQEYAEAAGNPGVLDGVRMISYQALMRMSDEEIAGIQADKMVLDEFHRTGAELWEPALQKLLEANPKAQVLGASATPVRYLDNARDIASVLFDRNLAVEMTLGEAVRRNILPAPKYVPVWYDIDGKLSQYERDVSKIKNKDERKDLEDKLVKLKKKLENAYGAEEIFEKNMSSDHGKFIVFCRDKGHLEEMKKTVPQWLVGVNPNVRSYVSISAQEDKDEQLQAFKDDKGEDAVKLLFTVDRLNEGLHVKGIDGVIMLRPTVSPIIYLQQMGRALSACGKTPLVFDMVNNYQNVQIPLEDGSKKNVFEAEFKSGDGREAEVGDFRIFEDMMEFSTMFERLEGALYPDSEAIWNKRFQEYVSYKNEFGQEPLWDEVYCGINLGSWCSHQRRNFKSGRLSEERIGKLQLAGFALDPYEAEWRRQMEVYVAYKKEFGQEPPAKALFHGVSIGSWCSHQRRDFKAGKLSFERIQRLRLAGFLFDPFEQDWQRQFALYVDYKKEFGQEPAQNSVYKEEALGTWCGTQRKAFKKGTLSDERIQKLQLVGFVFDRYEHDWQCKFDLYVAYKKEFGREPLSNTVYQGIKLGVWCSGQMDSFKQGRLSEEHREKLASVGFRFEGRMKSCASAVGSLVPSEDVQYRNELHESDKELLFKDFQSMKSLGQMSFGYDGLNGLAEQYGVRVDEVLRIVDEMKEKLEVVSDILMDATERSEKTGLNGRGREDYVLP